MERPGALGDWEDRPRRNTDADVTRAQLDHREAFVLTRIDGTSSIAEVCEMSGLGSDMAVRALERLVQLGLVRVERAAAQPRRDRALEAGWSAAAQGRPVDGRPVVGSRPAAPPLPEGVSRADLDFLRAKGRMGFVPLEPMLKPGGKDPVFGDFVFDSRELLERCDLTVEQRKEVLFRFHGLERMDHFELFSCEPTDDVKVLRNAYYAFSKRFHPDAYFGKHLGLFADKVERVHRMGSQIYEALRADGKLRETYFRVVLARNNAYRAKLEAERQAKEAERTAREVEAREAEAVEAEERKRQLEARLAERTRVRRESGLTNPMVDQLKRAERHYVEGMAQYDSGNFVAAASSLKLAMTFDPKNERYGQAFTRVNELAKQTRADQLWKRGYMEESIGRTREAIASYIEAVECYPRAEHLGHVADLMWQNEQDLHKAAELARQATEKDPHNVEFLVTLGRIYAKTTQVKRALAVFEKVLKYDSGNEIAKKAIKALKRM
jgi:tetratricopeptide (TPR) repeat protein